MPKVTKRCRERLAPIFEQYTLMTDMDGACVQESFFAGFIAGQCEKVHHGACRAAMFAYGMALYPMDVWKFTKLYSPIWEAYELIAIDDPARNEMWVTRTAANDVTDMLNFNHSTEERTRLWTRKRAALCGIERELVDEEYDLSLTSTLT